MASTSASGKELNVKINLVVNKANRQVDTLNKKIQDVQKQVNKSGTAAERFSNKIRLAVQNMKNLTQEAKRTQTAVDSMSKTLKGLLAAFGGVMALKLVIDTSDTITSAENKLNYLNAQSMGDKGYTTDAQGNTAYSPAALNATTQSMDDMYNASQRARTGYADMMSNVAKSMTLAPNAFQDDINNAIRFQETMAKAYTLGGASAAEQHSSMYQMIQALGSGRLQGDELRSVREGAPLAYQAIEKFAQGVLNSKESLKDLASEGVITSDIVVAAMMNMSESVDKAFGMTDITFAQVGAMIKNAATNAFRPVQDALNNILNSEQGKKAIMGIIGAVEKLGTILAWLVDQLATVFNFIVDNWSWVQFIFMALGLMLAALAGQAVATGIRMFIAMLGGLSPLYAWILVIGLVVAALAYLATQCENFVTFLITLLQIVLVAILTVLTIATVAYVAAGVVMFTIPTLIALLIVGIIAALLFVFLKFNRQILGFAYGLGAALSAIAYNIGQAFQNVWNGIQLGFWMMVKGLLAAAGPLVDLINVILGAFGKQTIDGYVDAQINSLTEDMSFKDIGAEFAAGQQRGYAASDNLMNTINGIGDNIKNLAGGFDFGSGAGGAYNMDAVTANTGDTANNTGRTANAMELAEEDLKYLRDLAEMEWKKEFTTASINVDMSNYNTIGGDSDLDGIVTKLSEKLVEELDSVANGVYAY